MPDNNPAGFNTPIPVDLKGLIQGYRTALKLLNEEIDRLNKKAEASLHTFGSVDQALINQSAALNQARQELRGNLSARKAELDLRNELDAKAKTAEESAAAEQVRLHARVQLQSVAMRKLGFSPSVINDATQYFHMASHTFTTGAATLERAGFSNIAKVAETIGAGFTRTAMGLGEMAMGPIGIGVGVATYMYKALDANYESIKTDSRLRQAQMDAYFRLVGKPNQMGPIETGNAERARQAFQALEMTREGALESAPVGVWDYLSDPFSAWGGRPVGAQVERAEKGRKFVEQWLQAKQTFGADYDPFRNPMVEQTARRIYKNPGFMKELGQTTESLAYATSGYIKGTVSHAYLGPLAPVFGFLEAWEDKKKYENNLYTEQLEIAGMHDIESIMTKRKAIEDNFRNSAVFAVNRVIGNEQRRWLRDVELDRIARFNNWSMT